MIRVTIESTARNALREEPHLFDTAQKEVRSIEEAREFLITQYGRLPAGRNRIYIDDKEGNPKVVGFTHSFWASDISHNSKSWYQTDWVSAVEYEAIPVNVL